MAKDAGKSSGYKYGSVSKDEEANEGDKSFDESNLYYVTDEEQTRKEKCFKALRLAVPILVAVLFVGGLIFLMFHGFGNLYPGRGGQNVSSKSYGGSSSSSSGESPSETTKRSVPKIPAPKTSGSSCASHPKCSDLGLFGSCCPTTEGVTLGCCS